jgi:hypothetical protein
MQPLRKLNEAGTAAFASYIEALKSGDTSPPPVQLLTDPSTSAPMPGGAVLDLQKFSTRGDLGNYLVSALKSVPQAELDHNPDVWNWLALFYFDEICPAKASGKRKVGAVARYLLPSVAKGRMHAFRYYRHLVAGPYRVARQHPGGAKVLQVSPPSIFSDLNEQIASRQELAPNRAVVGAMDLLYFDASTSKPKRGAGTNTRKPGTMRRLIDVLDQLDLTYDLGALTAEELLEILPPEFDRWIGRNAEAA